MARNNEVANLPGESVGASDGELSDAVIHGFHDVVWVNAEGHRHIDIELRNEEARLGRDGLGDGGIDGGNAGGIIVFRDNVSHEGGKNEAVILQEESDEDDKQHEDGRDSAAEIASFAHFAAGGAFVFHFLGGEVSLGGFGIIIVIIVFIIILPSGMVFFPFFGSGAGIHGGVFESAMRRSVGRVDGRLAGRRCGGLGGVGGLGRDLLVGATIRCVGERGLIGRNGATGIVGIGRLVRIAR